MIAVTALADSPARLNTLAMMVNSAMAPTARRRPGRSQATCRPALALRCAGREQQVKRREVDLLRVFKREAGRIVSRRALLQEVWAVPNPDALETRSVDMQLVKLRRTFQAVCPEIPFIETVRGEGYRTAAGIT